MDSPFICTAIKASTYFRHLHQHLPNPDADSVIILLLFTPSLILSEYEVIHAFLYQRLTPGSTSFANLCIIGSFFMGLFLVFAVMAIMPLLVVVIRLVKRLIPFFLVTTLCFGVEKPFTIKE